MESNQKSNIINAIYAVFLLVSSYVFWDFSKIFLSSLGLTIYVVLFVCGTGIYLYLQKIKFSVGTCFIAIYVLLGGIYFTLFDNPYVGILVMGVVFLYCMVWSGYACGNFIDKKVSHCIVEDVFNNLVTVPFQNFNAVGENLKGFKSVKDGKKSKEWFAGLLGVIIMIPILLIVISLLMNADGMFENMMDGITQNINFDWNIIWKLILTIPMACYIGGNVFGNIKKRGMQQTDKEEAIGRLDKLRFLPRATVYSGLTSLNLVYVLFAASQFNYLFDAMKSECPDACTYADYARRGFFEMCIVVALNLCVLAGAHICIKKNEDGSTISKVLRIESILLLGFSLGLIVVAFFKMKLYMDTYGLTSSRVYATWLISVMTFIVIAVLVRMLKQFRLTRVIVIGASVMLMILAYMNVDRLIAKVNIDRYLNSKDSKTKESELDYDALANLSCAAAPELKRLYYSDKVSIDEKKNIVNILWDNYRFGGLMVDERNLKYKPESFREYNYQKSVKNDIAHELLNDYIEIIDKNK